MIDHLVNRTEQQATVFTSFKDFQFFGYYLGGLAPVALFLMCKLFGCAPDILDDKYVYFFIALTLIGYIIGTLASKYETTLLLWEAIFSVIFIHLLVIYTNGPRSSVFAESYLYFVAIVGFVWGRGKNLYYASIVLAISYFSNLFFWQTQKDFLTNYIPTNKEISSRSEYSSVIENLFYLMVFCTQLLVTVTIVRASQRDAKNKAPQPEKI